ncbi:MAG: helix-turn-helix domain-containing protein [Prolixibacteraceae bacterium]|nr:helix-turn-helix domain-containing protein [Prolixibacteraceae bacterium]
MYFADNLKFLRQRRRKSQADLADILELTRTTLSGYEKNVQPPFRVLIKIAEYFNISLDALIRYDLKQLSEFQLSQIENGFDVDVTGKKLRLLTVSINHDGDENIEMVPIKAHAGYTSGLSDPDFISSLKRFSLPFLPKEKTYRTFQIKGDSMLPISEGSWVTCSYIENWTDVKDGTPCILVTKDEGIVFKLVYNQIKKNKTFLLVSKNRIYKPYEIEVKNTVEMWKFETYNGFEINS